MYYSTHNEDIRYINHYSGLLEVEGNGPLCAEDTGVWPDSGEEWTKEYHTLSVTEGITELRDGYLDAFAHVECLILSRTVTAIAASPALLSQLRDRNVLIRGKYDTFAEAFAMENGLTFLHSDIHLADDDMEHPWEHDIITLRFHPDQVPDIHYNCFTAGISAGSLGGGEFCVPLPSDFWVGCTVEEFAKRVPDRVTDQILSNEALKRFFEISNKRG